MTPSKLEDAKLPDQVGQDDRQQQYDETEIFSMVRRRAIKFASKDLTYRGVLALTALGFYVRRPDEEPHPNDQTCWPSLPTLAREVRCSVDLMRKGLRELESEGVLAIELRFNEKGSPTSSLYTLHDQAGETWFLGVVATSNQGDVSQAPGVVANANQGGSQQQPGVVATDDQGGSQYLHEQTRHQIRHQTTGSDQVVHTSSCAPPPEQLTDVACGHKEDARQIETINPPKDTARPRFRRSGDLAEKKPARSRKATKNAALPDHRYDREALDLLADYAPSHDWRPYWERLVAGKKPGEVIEEPWVTQLQSILCYFLVDEQYEPKLMNDTIDKILGTFTHEAYGDDTKTRKVVVTHDRPDKPFHTSTLRTFFFNCWHMDDTRTTVLKARTHEQVVEAFETEHAENEARKAEHDKQRAAQTPEQQAESRAMLTRMSNRVRGDVAQEPAVEVKILTSTEGDQESRSVNTLEKGISSDQPDAVELPVAIPMQRDEEEHSTVDRNRIQQLAAKSRNRERAKTEQGRRELLAKLHEREINALLDAAPEEMDELNEAFARDRVGEYVSQKSEHITLREKHLGDLLVGV
jgi:hypothetical protein